MPDPLWQVDRVGCLVQRVVLQQLYIPHSICGAASPSVAVTGGHLLVTGELECGSMERAACDAGFGMEAGNACLQQEKLVLCD